MFETAFLETLSMLPFALVSVVGLVVLAFRWKSMSEFAGTLLLCALVAKLFTYGASLWVSHWFHSQINEGAMLSELAAQRGWMSMPGLVMSVIAWGALVAAVFVRQAEPANSKTTGGARSVGDA